MPLALAACGFQPAYGPGGAAKALQGRVRVNDPNNKNAFDLVQRLEERLGRSDAPAYDLSYTINVRSIGVGVTADNSTTRYQLHGEVVWSLTARDGGARVTGGRVSNFASYSATGSTVAQLTANTDASLRLMRMLGDQIITQLIATSGSLK